MTDGVQQVGLASSGAAVDEQRIEGHLVGAGERACGVEGDLIGLADHEILEPVPGLERDRIKPRRLLRRLRLRLVRGRRDLDDRRGPRRRRTDPDPDLSNIGQARPPCQGESL